jgi:hypothetical protein
MVDDFGRRRIPNPLLTRGVLDGAAAPLARTAWMPVRHRRQAVSTAYSVTDFRLSITYPDVSVSAIGAGRGETASYRANPAPERTFPGHGLDFGTVIDSRIRNRTSRRAAASMLSPSRDLPAGVGRPHAHGAVAHTNAEVTPAEVGRERRTRLFLRRTGEGESERLERHALCRRLRASPVPTARVAADDPPPPLRTAPLGAVVGAPTALASARLASRHVRGGARPRPHPPTGRDVRPPVARHRRGATGTHCIVERGWAAGRRW